MNSIGFIGLGIMGRPMAANLIRAGNALVLHSRSGVPEDLKALGGVPASSPAAGDGAGSAALCGMRRQRP